MYTCQWEIDVDRFKHRYSNFPEVKWFLTRLNRQQYVSIEMLCRIASKKLIDRMCKHLSISTKRELQSLWHTDFMTIHGEFINDMYHLGNAIISVRRQYSIKELPF